jgi:carbon monoxide dehydrogenase subunit G
MTRFRASNRSEAVVHAERQEIWSALTDPELLPRLTPLLQRIDTGVGGEPDLWCWHLVKISVLGAGISTTFTERMRFDEGRRIEYAHEPRTSGTERTGANGSYTLRDVDGGTRLEIDLTLHVDLPLSRLAAPAIVRTMEAVMGRTGDRFATNLLNHLGTHTPRRS